MADEGYGDIHDELDEEILTCMYCDALVKCSLKHWGLDWTDTLEGWCQTGTSYVCPSCSFLVP